MTPLLLAQVGAEFPRPIGSYPPAAASLGSTLAGRVRDEPFNLVASAIFGVAILHTFLTPKIREWARRAEERHAAGGPRRYLDETGEHIEEVSFAGQILHLLGEVEAVFGVWTAVLLIAIGCFKGWGAAVTYVGSKIDFREPLFVMVIMALASTRPILRLTENAMGILAAVGGQTIAAWWLAILIFGPMLGSFVTEPGAMTISALLLARQFYHYKPSLRLKYATIGLLFVNVSVGGTLTNFAAPPMVMVAGPWNWSLWHFAANFGWKAFAGIVGSTLAYRIAFAKDFRELEARRLSEARFMTIGGGSAIPVWIVGVQIAFLVFTVAVSHFPPLFLGGFLFFLAFAQATAHHQKRLDLRGPLMVGFFLAGLVVLGGLQTWWLDPVLKSLGRSALFWGATFLTSFNDNAAITYLATLVPNFSDTLKYAVVAGAVTGGGLTVIANAPNPAGQALLQDFFPGGVSPIKLFAAAALPTLVMAAAFMLL